jgi:hypothetical protein
MLTGDARLRVPELERQRAQLGVALALRCRQILAKARERIRITRAKLSKQFFGLLAQVAKMGPLGT